MSEGRERQVVEAFVALANSLAEGADVVDLLSGLPTDCTRLLDIASAGLLLADQRGALHLLAASSEDTSHLEAFQLQRQQGPCLDCYHSGAPVTVRNLLREAERWPQFAEKALNLGFRSVHALPMRFQEHRLGALGLFGAATGGLNKEDLRLGQALADVASIAIAQGAATADKDRLNEQLQQALTSRVLIEQAKGLLAQLGGLNMVDAFNYLKKYCRDNNYRLSEVARQLTTRALDAAVVIDYASAYAQTAKRPIQTHRPASA